VRYSRCLIVFFAFPLLLAIWLDLFLWTPSLVKETWDAPFFLTPFISFVTLSSWFTRSHVSPSLSPCARQQRGYGSLYDFLPLKRKESLNDFSFGPALSSFRRRSSSSVKASSPFSRRRPLCWPAADPHQEIRRRESFGCRASFLVLNTYFMARPLCPRMV